MLPYLDGERTPNLPRAAGTIAGLRHDTTSEQILLAAYEGAVASLVEALELLGAVGSGLDPAAPVILIGGGARGEAWQRTVARLAGRTVQVPDADELVALGAAAQAAACLAGERPEEVARRWDTRGRQDRRAARRARHAHARAHPRHARGGAQPAGSGIASALGACRRRTAARRGSPHSASTATRRKAQVSPAANASRTVSTIRSAASAPRRASSSAADSVPASTPCTSSTSVSLSPAASLCRRSWEAVVKTVVVSPSPTEPPATWNM